MATTPSVIGVTTTERASSAAGIIGEPADPGQRPRRGQGMSKSRLAIQNVGSPAYVFDAVQTFEVEGDLAVARVVMYTDHGEPAYRQTRFYQRTGPDWRQTAPDAALWAAWKPPPLSITFAKTMQQPLSPSHRRWKHSFMLPEQYDEIWASHTLWLAAPVQLGIPLFCAEMGERAWFYSMSGRLLSLLPIHEIY